MAWKDPETRELVLRLRRNHMAKLMQDPAYAEKYRTYDREWKRERYWSDPEYREKRKRQSREYQRRKRAEKGPAPIDPSKHSKRDENGRFCR